MEFFAILAGLVFLSMLAAVAFASAPLRDLPEGRMDIVHSMEVETPHVPWANPYSRGAIRAWLMPTVVAGRDLVELAQRLEMKYATLTLDVSGYNTWGFGDFYGRRGRRGNYEIDYQYLTEDMTSDETYEVLVLPGIHAWGDLPKEARQAILKRVQGGAGLVLVAPTADPEKLEELAELSPILPTEFVDHQPRRETKAIAGEQWKITKPHWITSGVPIGLLPFDQMSRRDYGVQGEVLITAGKGPILAIRECGKGRVAAFAYTNFGFSPRVKNPWAVNKSYPYWEVYYSLLARTIIWAARKEPSAQVSSVEVAPAPVPYRLEESHKAAVVRISLSGQAQRTTLELTLRDDTYNREHQVTREVQLNPDANSVELPIPEGLKGGLHFADVILKNEVGTLDWATATFEVDRPVSIEKVELDQDVVKLGEQVSGKVVLTASRPAEVAIELRFEDNYRRVLDRNHQSLKVEGRTGIPFKLSTGHGLTRLGHVVCEIKDGKRLVDHKSATLFVRIPQVWEDYEIIMDRFLPEPAPGRWPAIASRLEQMNVSVMGAVSAEMCMHVNFMIQADVVAEGFHPRYHQPQWNRNKRQYVETGDKKYLLREPCYSDPDYRERFHKKLKEDVERFVRFSPISYYAYEEASLGYFGDGSDICWSPSCLKGFRKWLGEVYGSLAALNAEWETSYTSWDQVMPLTAVEAQEKGNYPPWADHRTFMEILWADVYREGKEVIRAIDPNANICLSGNQDCTPHNGYDYSRLNLYIDQMQQYTGWNVEDFDRSFYPGMKLTGCTGYGVSKADLALQLWGRLFQGETAGCVIFWEISCLDPDLTFCKSGRDLAKNFGEIRAGGIARLLSAAKFDSCGIAIHYSYPSFHGTWITDGKITNNRGNKSLAFDLFDRGRVAWSRLLEELGYQYEFVSYGQIEEGDLIKRGFRLLIMPESVAISEAEARAIEEFVKEGGTVMADLWPAVMDEHCKWRSTGRLDEVFGIAHQDIRPQDFQRQEAGERIRTRTAEKGWCDGHPSITRSKFGKGEAFYLGFSLAPMVARRRQQPEAKETSYLDALAKLMLAADIAPPAKVTEDGEPASTCEAFHFLAEGAEYFALIRYRGAQEGNADVSGGVPPVPDARAGRAGNVVKIAFPRAGHVYDVREKKYLGHIDSLEAALQVGDAKLFALLPYTIEDLSVTIPASVKAGEVLRYQVKLTASEGTTPGNHVVVIKVFAPEGKEVRLYGSRLALKQGVAEGSIPLSLSDEIGTWRLVATDVVSGTQGEATVAVTSSAK